MCYSHYHSHTPCNHLTHQGYLLCPIASPPDTPDAIPSSSIELCVPQYPGNNWEIEGYLVSWMESAPFPTLREPQWGTLETKVTSVAYPCWDCYAGTANFNVNVGSNANANLNENKNRGPCISVDDEDEGDDEPLPIHPAQRETGILTERTLQRGRLNAELFLRAKIWYSFGAEQEREQERVAGAVDIDDGNVEGNDKVNVEGNVEGNAVAIDNDPGSVPAIQNTECQVTSSQGVREEEIPTADPTMVEAVTRAIVHGEGNLVAPRGVIEMVMRGLGWGGRGEGGRRERLG